jgi:selenocysteine-specific elongation factor
MSSESRQINITIGTAGHIDHGKTALVKNLTGCDTDYLKEEKERGMSIELGFAPCEIAGLQAGIVDVPGHEHFIKTMVAGASGMDAVLFVVAADDGIMPQTREHLDILTLLGIRQGMVVLTKCDRVGMEERQTALEQVRDFCRGTFLENSPILPVSNVTGEGFSELLDELKALVGRITPRQTTGLFRMPVEKVFSVKGYGTVITGVPAGGSARIGDELFLPGGQGGRIKTIQVYSRSAQAVLAGQCAAINIPQFDHSEVKRGDVLVRDRCFSAKKWYFCTLKVLGHAKSPLKNGQRIKFHTGTSDVVATVYLADGEMLAAGEEGTVQIRLEEPVCAAYGDPFIMRGLTPPTTLGGGRIIEGLDQRLRRDCQELTTCIELARAGENSSKALEIYLKRFRTSAATIGELADVAQLPQRGAAEILAGLVKSGIAASIGERFAHIDSVTSAKCKLLEKISEYHAQNPATGGCDPAVLAKIAEIGNIFDYCLTDLLAQGQIIKISGKIALKTHSRTVCEKDRIAMEQIEGALLKNLFSPPGKSELMECAGLSEKDLVRIMKMLIDNDAAVAVESEMWFHRTAIEQAAKTLKEYIQREGKLESVKFKYIINTTRKHAIPLLDYFDRISLTRRSGYTRYLNPAFK